jgi:hypothetical protein
VPIEAAQTLAFSEASAAPDGNSRRRHGNLPSWSRLGVRCTVFERPGDSCLIDTIKAKLSSHYGNF